MGRESDRGVGRCGVPCLGLERGLGRVALLAGTVHGLRDHRVHAGPRRGEGVGPLGRPARVVIHRLRRGECAAVPVGPAGIVDGHEHAFHSGRVVGGPSADVGLRGAAAFPELGHGEQRLVRREGHPGLGSLELCRDVHAQADRDAEGGVARPGPGVDGAEVERVVSDEVRIGRVGQDAAVRDRPVPCRGITAGNA